VNGYFELSSDRRGVWSGDDLTGGEGKTKSVWNQALLQDAVASAYARLLVHGRSVSPQHAQACVLWPAVVPTAPWDSLVRATYAKAAKLPCLWSNVDGGKWIAPRDAVLLQPRAAHSVSTTATMTTSDVVVQALLMEGVPLVAAPTRVQQLLLQFKCVKGCLSPAFVRNFLRVKDDEAVARARPTAVAAAATDADTDAPFGRKCLASSHMALALLRYCTSDIPDVGNSSGQATGAAQASDLVGLPLLPLGNGKLGVIRAHVGGVSNTQRVFVCGSESEVKLWTHARHRILNPNAPAWVKTVLSAEPVQVCGRCRV